MTTQLYVEYTDMAFVRPMLDLIRERQSSVSSMFAEYLVIGPGWKHIEVDRFRRAGDVAEMDLKTASSWREKRSAPSPPTAAFCAARHRRGVQFLFGAWTI